MQIVLIILGALWLLAYLLPLFDRVFNLATVLGAIAGALILGVGIKWTALSFSTQKYVAFIIILGNAFLYFLMRSVMDKGRATTDKGNLLIVLGCRVRGDIPSLALEKRVDAAFFFLQNNPNARAILSGGQGPDEYLSEALCMKNMLTERGIAGDRLFLEERSTSTGTNIAFSKEIIEENELGEDVVICTSEYHQYRARLICTAMGLNAQAISSKTKPILLPTFLLRELMAIVKERIMMKF